MTSPLAELARSRSGALVALPPRGADPCAQCGDALREACAWFGCPFVPDSAPPSEDDYERFLEAELARGRP